MDGQGADAGFASGGLMNGSGATLSYSSGGGGSGGNVGAVAAFESGSGGPAVNGGGGSVSGGDLFQPMSSEGGQGRSLDEGSSGASHAVSDFNRNGVQVQIGPFLLVIKTVNVLLCVIAPGIVEGPLSPY
jgi:hypothetical protein